MAPHCKKLILDAGPLLSLSPLRGLAETFVTAPQVLAELKDRRAREHLERLGSQYGINIEVMTPDPASLVAVIAKAKETGDYSVLSHPDICVLALTHTLHHKFIAEAQKKALEPTVSEASEGGPPVEEESTEEGGPEEEPVAKEEGQPEDEPLPEEEDEPEEESVQEEDLEPLDVELESIQDKEPTPTLPESSDPSAPIYDDPSDEDDGQGEWITPANVGIHKSRALDLLPSANGKGKAPQNIDVGCMTADFAMQNVLLQMGLNLVSSDGRKIDKVKNWVLRCHACFKICKDASKKFCPSCGNPTLLRTSVTIAGPGASANTPALQVHLKTNFQYKIRGTKYSIPAPKAGSAKTGPGEGLILREDQTEYMRAKRLADGKREREEAKMLKGILSRGVDGGLGSIGSWMDPDWVPEIMSAGTGGKGRTIKDSRMDGDMPIIGHGRKNPNERKRRK
ncbi:Nin one binding Zn-ribbon like-domain-containing protein [Mycena floridula]|nr:Nin one binding Zn-ribbon like-domain-containing protein [Mycena floridula]